ncbi:hypothetical protein FPOAC2_03417 [Fusarium poae]|jgi:hypothetical protein|uniref:F-box domain-containing protein n=1 Tax=Fusarium poae TaxID=36050 RepID=A0A1B8B909_FUSPO|nr:hypothetical protein FPOAC1_003310 [Fusarium poae]KAG8677294.1 hypothetical protein FPOAC1_003310 [Fusarium poae]OBS29209.1 hypothetical protein FPOA_03146 [Fusarium poae]
MHNLPVELVNHILTFIDPEADLQSRIYQDPAKLSRPVSSGPNTPLKNASLVCRLWRTSLIKPLFRHVVWSFWRFFKPTTQDIVSEIEVLSFIRRNNLSSTVESFTILIDVPKKSGEIQDPDAQFWGVLPPAVLRPEARPTMYWSHSVSDNERDGDHEQIRYIQDRIEVYHDNNWLWHTIFNVIDPLRITLISPIDTLACLVSRSVDLSSNWAFDNTYHVLSLSRPSRSPGHKRGSDLLPSQLAGLRDRIPCDLFHIRDWPSLLINEGSFAPVYSTYEFFHYSAATLLPAIFDSSDPSFSIMCENLKSLSYIATFPLSHQISDFLIPHCPPVEHLFVQLMPKDRDFWESSSLAKVNLSDLWLECDTSYALLVRQMLQPVPQQGWQRLRVFESGDKPAEGVWRMNTYDAQINGVNGWKEESEGVFVKDVSQDDSQEQAEQAAEDEL